jgi:asparaginyl-tRNA synthetase
MFGDVDFSERKIAILKVRAKILQAVRFWLDKSGYLEVQGPVLIPAVGDWPGYLAVEYLGRKVYLAQGLQPYADSLVKGFEKIYTVAPSFRVEKVETKRHLTEYWRIEVTERCEFGRLINVQEELLKHVCRSLAKGALEELKCLGRSPEDLVKIRSPFPKLTYEEVVEILRNDGVSISWGQEIDWSLERYLSTKFAYPFFVTEFPEGTETLFYKSHPTKLGATLTVDLLAPEGYGEMGSGGQTEDELNMLRRKMVEEKIDSREKRWYLSLRRLEVSPISGFAIGIERLIQWICKLENIGESTARTRSSDAIYP